MSLKSQVHYFLNTSESTWMTWDLSLLGLEDLPKGMGSFAHGHGELTVRQG